MVEQCGTVWTSVVHKWNSVKQCGRTVWHCVVEKSGTVWWNSGTVWHNVAQCGTM